MTDTFANGPGAPGNAPLDETQQSGDLTNTLADLERKLRELEGELSSIGRRRTPADAPPALSGTEGLAGGRLVDEAIEPPAARPATSSQPMKFLRPGDSARQQPPRPQPPQQAGPQQTGLQHAEPQPAAPHTYPPSPPPTPQPLRPHTPPPPAAEPQERVRPSEAQLASLAELRRFRDRLEGFARDLAAEYDALLGRVMSGLTSLAAPADYAPAAAPAAAPGAASTAVPAESPRATSDPEDALFEGHVELGVGPFYDMAALTAFERQLAGLAFVAEASVRRFEASHAVVDVRLATPVALVRELRRSLDSDFGVREIAERRVLLTFDEA